ncbi:putative parvulin-type peptidyl-prolyl cis-trans isomerase precursor [Rhodobacteraceae bacterium THAF1]|uniref:peptidylprolyl isomerase n=1 Tax=Palleronia sp. THAF1 TaxID=2587842 RepID=UPI000F400BA6|nr:peptidylprolyl isomerase [Palleronia sp. THAF1]QFU07094.1 putative parvulin-type peptidyl-prolyl cis-trans isomerase precursor [Palleronia sp. THAF1]VDC16753.1 putative parvulin-type peptidyl-prolyl cis-trans isomerase precursor [Rhodobacteraceae bacterium THAF1]
MPKLRTLAALLALSTAMPAFAQDATQDASTVVATVNGTDITLGHMIAMRARLPQQYQGLEDQVLYDGILEQLVQQTALGAQADGLSTRGELTIENERRALVAGEVIQRLAADAVTEEQVQAAYDAEYGGVEPTTEYNASHILVETEEEAQALIEELDGGADFAELAIANSTGPSGPSGGELGWFGAGAMVGPFDAAVQEMEVGAVAGPVETQFGWHVIKLNDTREEAVPSLEEVRADIEGQLQIEAIEGLATSAVEDAEMTEAETEIDPAIIRNDALLD